MYLSKTKIEKIELIASKFKVNPDLLVEALLDVGLKKKETKQSKQELLKKLTPEQKVKYIEEEALNKGWTYEQLWAITNNTDYSKKGLIYFVEDGTTIGEVTEKHIVLIHERTVGVPVINNFYNMKVEQPWIRKTHDNSLTLNDNILNVNELVADVKIVNTKNEVSKL